MRYPDTLWDPVANRSRTVIKPDVYIVHVAVSESRDIYGPGKGPGGTYAHFYVPREGPARQHQDTRFMSQASGGANIRAISVETQGMGTAPFTDHQIDLHAYLFAMAVLHDGVPNRIATPNDVRGLAWHRLGIRGNFGNFNSHDMTTWCAKQTGENWSSHFGKLCPTNHVIRQIPEIYKRAQAIINGGGKTPPSKNNDLDVDGWFGPATIGRMQQIMKTPVDNEIWHQWPGNRKHVPRASNGWKFDLTQKGSAVIRSLQRKMAVKADGLAGPATIKALQRKLAVEADGYMGEKTVKAIQTNLNKGKVF